MRLFSSCLAKVASLERWECRRRRLTWAVVQSVPDSPDDVLLIV